MLRVLGLRDQLSGVRNQSEVARSNTGYLNHNEVCIEPQISVEGYLLMCAQANLQYYMSSMSEQVRDSQSCPIPRQLRGLFTYLYQDAAGRTL